MTDKNTPYSDAYRKHNSNDHEEPSNTAKNPLNTEKHGENPLNDRSSKEAAGESINSMYMGAIHKAEETIKEVKDALTTKKARKVEHYVVFGIYLVVFLIAGYFVLLNTNPDILPNDFYNYELDATSKLIDSSLRSFYLEDAEALGAETKIDGVPVRMIVLEKPFNFVFKPKRKIEEGATARIELAFVRPDTEIYLNNELIIPDLDGYSKLAEFADQEVWVKDSLIRSSYGGGIQTWDDEDLVVSYTEGSASDFIYNNFPGVDFYSFGEVSGGVPILADYKKTITRIDTRFRGNLKLAVYAEGDLKIDFIKQDLNSYVGKDEYTVEITDLDGNSYFKETYKDDGDKKDTNEGDFEQRISITGDNLPRGIYYITFTRDENNKAADSTIKNIKINSNKVLIIGRSLPIDSLEFYTEVSSPKTIGFEYWWSSKEQKIRQTGTVDDVIDLDEDWLNEKYEQELKRGDYNFEIKTGMVWIYSDSISPSEENWFNLPRERSGKLIDNDIIVIDSGKLKINGDVVKYTGIINVTDNTKIKVQALDKLETYFKDIKLVLI